MAINQPISQGVFSKLCLLFVMITFLTTTTAKRYRYCGEGCCPHEFCAFHTICYPHITCAFGCPDGVCDKGVCMPQKPCHNKDRCAMAHHCSYNYNLGYNTCQYNLDIGLTTCVDRDGHPLIKEAT